jgi:hypothetical protein
MELTGLAGDALSHHARVFVDEYRHGLGNSLSGFYHFGGCVGHVAARYDRQT